MSERDMSAIEAALDDLLAKMAEPTGEGDELAERLLAEWEDLNREYDVACERQR